MPVYKNDKNGMRWCDTRTGRDRINRSAREVLLQGVKL